MKSNKRSNTPPIHVPIVRGTITHPIIELELEYEDEIEPPVPPRNAKNDVVVWRPGKIAEITMEIVDLTGDATTAQVKPSPHPARKNGKPKAARSKTRKKKPVRRGKS